MAEKNLSSLINGLNLTRKSIEVLNKYQVKELSLDQQQLILSSILNPIETPVKFLNTLNKIILENISDEHRSSLLVSERPILVRAIRDLSLGTKITKDNSNFEFTKFSVSKLNKIETSKTITLDDIIKIDLVIPNIEADIKWNNKLIENLNNIKDNEDLGKITNIYFDSELIRYIKSISFNNEVYTFEEMTQNEQKMVIKNLSQQTIFDITEFIASAKSMESECFTIKNLDTKEKTVIPMDYRIFSKEF